MLHLDSFPIEASTRPLRPVQEAGGSQVAQILIPEEVDIPLPRDTIEQVAVPASINGRDLSEGQP